MENSRTNFFKDVYEVVKLIPKGRVTSYGAVAEYLGSKGSARMVGWAMHGAAKIGGVPAHRVVNSKGLLTGKIHFGGNRMEQLLKAEGIKVVDDKILDFDSVFWNPVQELGFD
ncbi:MAG: MGMT family protein [Bacteroidetes bacterium]|nr:MGMT family protein [Bacteroidota bacterium]MDA1122388.1 MGMT family protein [Bacteroidota bacterium]